MQNVEIESFKIVGIAVRTSNQDGKAAKDIPALWERFMAEDVLSKIPNKVDNTIYSAYTEYEGDHNLPYTTVIGCRVENLDSVPEGMKSASVDGGKYVKFTAKGDLEKDLIINEWMKIWSLDLDRKYTIDYEVFGEKAQDPKNAEVDILIAVN